MIDGTRADTTTKTKKETHAHPLTNPQTTPVCWQNVSTWPIRQTALGPPAQCEARALARISPHERNRPEAFEAARVRSGGGEPPTINNSAQARRGVERPKQSEYPMTLPCCDNGCPCSFANPQRRQESKEQRKEVAQFQVDWLGLSLETGKGPAHVSKHSTLLQRYLQELQSLRRHSMQSATTGHFFYWQKRSSFGVRAIVLCLTLSLFDLSILFCCDDHLGVLRPACSGCDT